MPTREQLEEQYETIKDTIIIKSPGKYESELLYVPYLWESPYEDELISTYNETARIIKVDEDIVNEFPELENVAYVSLIEDNQGFVTAEELDTKDDLEALRERAKEVRKNEKHIELEAHYNNKNPEGFYEWQDVLINDIIDDSLYTVDEILPFDDNTAEKKLERFWESAGTPFEAYEHLKENYAET